MRRLPAVLTVASAAAALVAGCSSSPAPSSGSSSVVSTAVDVPESGSATTISPSTTPSKKSREPLPDAAAILRDSSASTAELDSAHVSLSVAGDMENMPIIALDGDVTSLPSPAAKGYAKIGYRGSPAYVSFIIFGGDLYVAGDRGTWIDYGPATNFYDVAAILSPEAGLADLLTDFVDPEAEGRETVDGLHTVRISGEVSADVAKKIVPQLQTAKRTACTVWIQESGDHRLVALKLASGDEGGVKMGFSNWDAPVTVVKPRTP